MLRTKRGWETYTLRRSAKLAAEPRHLAFNNNLPIARSRESHGQIRS